MASRGSSHSVCSIFGLMFTNKKHFKNQTVEFTLTLFQKIASNGLLSILSVFILYVVSDC